MESRPGCSPPRRRRDPEASRAAILEAAREVFAERGYARATIREIARRAGVTHGLVMRHFGSKEQLLIEALPGPRAAAEGVPGDLTTLRSASRRHSWREPSPRAAAVRAVVAPDPQRGVGRGGGGAAVRGGRARVHRDLP
jgi:hypothetical protein